MHGALELGRAPDVAGAHGEIGVLLKALGGDDIPEQVDHLFGLQGHLHLAGGVVEQVAPVLSVGLAEVVGGAALIELHAHQAQPGIHEVLPHMGHVGDLHAVEDAIGGMGDGLVEAVLGHTDGGRADVELADVHGIERRIPGLRAPGEDVVFGDGVIMQGEVGYVLLVGDDVLLQLIGLVAVVGDKEGVVVRAVLDLAQGGDHLGLVAVADVVLLAVGHPGAVAFRGQGRLGGVDVRAMGPLGKAEGEDRPFLEQLGRLLFGLSRLGSSRWAPGPGWSPGSSTSSPARRRPAAR